MEAGAPELRNHFALSFLQITKLPFSTSNVVSAEGQICGAFLS